MIRGQIDELLMSGLPVGEVIDETARLGAQLLLQMALEAEVDEFLGVPGMSARPGRRGCVRGSGTGTHR